LTVLSIVVLAIIYFVFLYEIVSVDQKESGRREALTNDAMMQIAAYHDKNGHYPKNLQNLPIYHNKKFVNYLNKHEFTYYSSGTNYSFSWRGGAMNWTGYSCTNFKGKPHKYETSNIIRTYHKVDGVICTVTDLH